MQDAVVPMIATQRADLLSLLAGVAAGDWDRPTVCAPWTVKDVIAHLVEGELNTGRIYRGEATAPGYVDAQEGIARWAALPGEAIRAALWQHGTATQRVLDAMTDAVWRAPIEAFGCRTIAQLVRLHLFELSVHAEDVARALDAPSVWDPRLPYLVEFVVRAAPATLRRLSVEPDGAMTVVTAGLRRTIDGRSGEWSVTDEEAPALVKLDDADLVRATTGRATVDEVLGRARIEGDRAVAQRLMSAWQVLATPPSPSR